MILNTCMKLINKNISKLKQISIILLYIVIIAVNVCFYVGEKISIGDNGKRYFNVYLYNVQGEIVIDYATKRANSSKYI